MKARMANKAMLTAKQRTLPPRLQKEIMKSNMKKNKKKKKKK